MKKLVKPFKCEEELQLVNALCAEYLDCKNMFCAYYRSPEDIICYSFTGDDETQNDILF